MSDDEGGGKPLWPPLREDGEPEPDPNPTAAYYSRLKLWALGSAAALLYLIVGALVNRWLGPQPSLPIPPPIPGVVVVSAGGAPIECHVIRPE